MAYYDKDRTVRGEDLRGVIAVGQDAKIDFVDCTISASTICAGEGSTINMENVSLIDVALADCRVSLSECSGEIKAYGCNLFFSNSVFSHSRIVDSATTMYDSILRKSEVRGGGSFAAHACVFRAAEILCINSDCISMDNCRFEDDVRLPYGSIIRNCQGEHVVVHATNVMGRRFDIGATTDGDGSMLISSGCRTLSPDEAIEHWGHEWYEDVVRGDFYVNYAKWIAKVS